MIAIAERLRAAGVSRFREGEFEIELYEKIEAGETVNVSTMPDPPEWPKAPQGGPLSRIEQQVEAQMSADPLDDPLNDPMTFRGAMAGYPLERIPEP